MEIYFLNYLILVRDTHTIRILWGFLLIEVQCFNIYLIKFIYLHFCLRIQMLYPTVHAFESSL